MTSFAENMSKRTDRMKAHAELGIRASGFMFRLCEIVNDPRLTKATNIFWDESGMRNPERVHNFSCTTPNDVEVPEWLHIGGLIRPNSLFITFDGPKVSYHIAQDFSGEDFKEVSLVVSSPFDLRYARWNATVGHYDAGQDDDQAEVIPINESLEESNNDFGALTSAVEFGLQGGEFERVELEL